MFFLRDDEQEWFVSLSQTPINLLTDPTKKKKTWKGMKWYVVRWRGEEGKSWWLRWLRWVGNIEKINTKRVRKWRERKISSCNYNTKKKRLKNFSSGSSGGGNSGWWWCFTDVLCVQISELANKNHSKNNNSVQYM